MVVAEEKAAARVGRFTLTVAAAEDNPESRQRWQERSGVLTSWLVAEWLREHKEGLN